MPFVSHDKRLAHVAKVLPVVAMAVWCDAANAAEALGLEHNDCVRAAWDEVGKNWRKPDAGKKWIAKDMTPGDVHVDAPLGSKKPKPKATDPDGDDDAGTEDFETSGEVNVAKVDTGLGLVFGWAIVCKKDGEDYFDLQGDNIPEDAMLKAAADFMVNSRVAKDMHQGDEIGPIVFCWPMTADIAKSMGIDTGGTTGLMIAMKPPADILAKFADGSYTGFSIGGERQVDEETE